MSQRTYFLLSLILVCTTAAGSDISTSTTSSGPPRPETLLRGPLSYSSQPLSITTTTASVTGTRYIKPPWPWVTGHLIFSAIIGFYGVRNFRKTQKAIQDFPGSPQATKTGLLIRLLQYFNFLVALGAVIALVRNVINGHIFIPGLGMAIELATLMICGEVKDAIYSRPPDPTNEEALQRDEAASWGFFTRLFFRANTLLFYVGFSLYLAVGAYAASAYTASNGPSKSVMLVVNTGCDSSCSNRYTDQRLYQRAGGDQFHLIAWGISCFHLGVVVLVNLLIFVSVAGRYSAIVFPHPAERKEFMFWMIVWAGPLAIISTILDSASANGSFYDCTGSALVSAGGCEGCAPFVYTPCVPSSIYFPNNVLGFWDLWAKSKIAVLEGLVLW